jgi:hypothetical protein
MTLCVMKIILKEINTNPLLFVYIRLNYFPIYVHSHYQKRIINKELHIVPFWKSMMNVFII